MSTESNYIKNQQQHKEENYIENNIHETTIVNNITLSKTNLFKLSSTTLRVKNNYSSKLRVKTKEIT